MNFGNINLQDVADYLGHEEKNYLDHYRLPSAIKDIVRMANILDDNCTTSGELFYLYIKILFYYLSFPLKFNTNS